MADNITCAGEACEKKQTIVNIKADILILKRAIIKLIEKVEDCNNNIDKLEERINVLRSLTIDNLSE